MDYKTKNNAIRHVREFSRALGEAVAAPFIYYNMPTLETLDQPPVKLQGVAHKEKEAVLYGSPDAAVHGYMVGKFLKYSTVLPLMTATLPVVLQAGLLLGGYLVVNGARERRDREFQTFKDNMADADEKRDIRTLAQQKKLGLEVLVRATGMMMAVKVLSLLSLSDKEKTDNAAPDVKNTIEAVMPAVTAQRKAVAHTYQL